MSESIHRLVIVASVAAGAVAVVLISMFSTNPTVAGPFGVTLWFVVVFVAISAVLTLGISGIKQLLGLESVDRRILFGSLRQAMLAGGWLTLLLALSSLRQLGARDALLTLALVIVIELYFSLKA